MHIVDPSPQSPALLLAAQARTHTMLSVNSACGVGSNLILGGLPLGHGATQLSNIHRPIFAERSSLQLLQKDGERVTRTLSPPPIRTATWDHRRRK